MYQNFKLYYPDPYISGGSVESTARVAESVDTTVSGGISGTEKEMLDE